VVVDREEPPQVGRAVAVVEATPAPDRPVGFRIGFGLGYDFGSNLDTPNLASVRFRLPSGLTIEPTVGLVHASQTNDDGIAAEESSSTGLALAAQLRYPVASHGRADLLLVGGALLGRTVEDPDGADNNVTHTIAGLIAGLGIDYWITPALSISSTTTSPLVTYEKITEEQTFGDDTERSATGLGIAFLPELDVMLHLYW
jgi:hypothetical protein